jgi:hypothetical protein
VRCVVQFWIYFNTSNVYNHMYIQTTWAYAFLQTHWSWMNEQQRHYSQITNGVYMARVSANICAQPPYLNKILISLESAFGYKALFAMSKHERSNGESAEPYLKRENIFYNILFYARRRILIRLLNSLIYLTLCCFHPKISILWT